jgi:hypothetical protein
MARFPYKFVIQTLRICSRCKEKVVRGRYVPISRTRQCWVCERCA